MYPQYPPPIVINNATGQKDDDNSDVIWYLLLIILGVAAALYFFFRPWWNQGVAKAESAANVVQTAVATRMPTLFIPAGTPNPTQPGSGGGGGSGSLDPAQTILCPENVAHFTWLADGRVDNTNLPQSGAQNTAVCVEKKYMASFVRMPVKWKQSDGTIVDGIGLDYLVHVYGGNADKDAFVAEQFGNEAKWIPAENIDPSVPPGQLVIIYLPGSK
jgi:hypothetical protein